MLNEWRSFSKASMLKVKEVTEFHDEGEPDKDGMVEYTYSGHYYIFTYHNSEYRVRVYDTLEAFFETKDGQRLTSDQSTETPIREVVVYLKSLGVKEFLLFSAQLNMYKKFE